jgi:hypothetical protein
MTSTKNFAAFKGHLNTKNSSLDELYDLTLQDYYAMLSKKDCIKAFSNSLLSLKIELQLILLKITFRSLYSILRVTLS